MVLGGSDEEMVGAGGSSLAGLLCSVAAGGDNANYSLQFIVIEFGLPGPLGYQVT